MGTQSQNLTTPRTWASQAVQSHSAWNLEADHVVSQARLQLPEGIPESSPTRVPSTCVPWQPKTDPERQPTLCPQLSPSARPQPCCGFGVWSLLGPNPNPNPMSDRDPPPKPKPASISKRTLESPVRMSPHFSPRWRSRDRSRFVPGHLPGLNPNPS